MLFRRAVTALGLVFALVAGPFLGASPAQADTSPAPSESITRAGDWIEHDYLTKCTGGEKTSYNCSEGGLADAILALASTNDPKYSATIETMSADLETQVADYTKDRADATAKIIIAALAAGKDPHNYGGIDLSAQLDTQIAEGHTQGLWTSYLAIMAKYRMGEPIPDSMVDLAISKQADSGGFGWGHGTADGDSTAVGLMAMKAASASNSKAAASYEKAVAWTNDPANLTTDDTGTYWTNYSPTNTVGMMLSAIGDIDDSRINATAQMQFLQGRQLASGAFSNTLKGTNDDAMATTQALMGLAMTGYLTVKAPQVSDVTFSDVAADNMFHTEITWLAQRGITTGYPDGTFRPLQPIHRDAMAAFLYRMAGSPAYEAPAQSKFSDVPTTSQFYKEISWLAEQNITTGWPDKTFRPLDNVNRDAMAAFLYRFAKSPSYTPPKASKFSDVPTNSQFYTEISWLAEQGISTGWDDGTFRPLQPINRDAMAAFLYRYNSVA